MNRTGICVVLGILLVAGPAVCDWPQYGGPDRNNVSLETGLADSWPEGGPKVLWEAAVSDGYAAPVVKDDKVYLLGRDGGNGMLRCLDIDSGKEVWSCSFADPGEIKSKKYNVERGIPTIAGDAAFVVTGHGTFACIDLKSHRVKWRHHLANDYHIELFMFGVCQSPLVCGDMVLVAPHAPDAGVAAYDRKSGERLWVSQGLGKYSWAYTSPVLMTVCGQEMIVAAGSEEYASKSRGRNAKDEPKKELVPGHIVGLSPKDGSTLWDYTGWQCEQAIPGPTPVGNDRIFITGGYDAGSAMIQIVQAGGGLEVNELYKTDVVGSQLHQPIQLGNHLFIGSNSNTRNDGLACFNIAGTLAWRTKDIEGAPNFERGSFIMADGKLILLDGKSGILYLAKADAAGYQPLASAPMVGKNDMAWAPLALSGGRLLVRDWTTLKCVDLK
ncbi:MAG: PQQ-like beta-propeller repeat protein [Kiritimatiellales bacterium]|nr:PQQ-like beta-propeller repeat protein [Kiritimatiellales bacterium]